MNPIQILGLVIGSSGLLIALLSIPLILGCVPPNDYYGVRTRASRSSEADWYRINQIGGRYLAVSGFIILVTGVVGFFLPVSAAGTYSIAATAITLVVVIVPCLRLFSLKPLNDSGGR